MKMLSKKLMISFSKLPYIIEDYLAQIPAIDLTRRRNPDTWTIEEHVFHIAGVQKMLLDRIKTVKENTDPVIEPYFPDQDKGLLLYQNIGDALEEYKKYRIEQIKLIEKCSKNELSKSALHKEYNRYTIPIIVNHMVFHEYWHMYRIEEIWLTKDEYFK